MFVDFRAHLVATTTKKISFFSHFSQQMKKIFNCHLNDCVDVGLASWKFVLIINSDTRIGQIQNKIFFFYFVVERI